MPYLLNVVYLLAIVVASPWLLYRAIRTGRYREGFAAKFLGHAPRRTGKRPCIWLHAVSVGEVNLLEPLLKTIETHRPDCECVISTTTATGMALAKKKYAPRIVFYCPLDFTWAVASAMRRIRPDLLVLTELELWPNLVRGARRHGAAVAVINGRLSQRSHRGYRRIRPVVQGVLRQMAVIAAQDEAYAARFRDLGTEASAVHVTGSVKFDGARTDRLNAATQRLAALAGIAPTDVVFLAGSTQEPEESIALSVFRRLQPDWPSLRLILVPRHPERFDSVARLLDESGIPWQRRSKLCESAVQNASSVSATADAERAAHQVSRVLLVDAVGELGAWWGTAAVGFVGGSLGRRGGQNMIEPAAYGAAVCFGPNTWNFRDVVRLMLERDAAVDVHNEAELETFLRRCLEQPDYAAALGGRAQALVLEQQGATERTWRLLEPLLPRPA